MHLSKGGSQATIGTDIEEMIDDVAHPQARPEEGMNEVTSAEPPRTAGVPNAPGYQEDQPLDAASATCCALLRPLPKERPPGSSLRRRRRGNSHPSKR